jgi:translation initiation factor IF-1
MVKNTTGGTKTKGLARKHQRQTNSTLIIPTNELEQIVCVTKLYGNGMCEVFNESNQKFIAHIRNKFRGKQKRHNLITVSTIIMVGMRDWEKPFKNCDVMEIYSDNQIEQLKQLPSLTLDHVLHLRNNHGNAFKETNDFDFTAEIEEEEIEEVKHLQEFTMETIPDVNIDDI